MLRAGGGEFGGAGFGGGVGGAEGGEDFAAEGGWVVGQGALEFGGDGFEGIVDRSYFFGFGAEPADLGAEAVDNAAEEFEAEGGAATEGEGEGRHNGLKPDTGGRRRGDGGGRTRRRVHRWELGRLRPVTSARPSRAGGGSKE